MKTAQLTHLRFPGNTTCRLALAKAEVRMGRFADALPRLKAALDRDPTLTEARTLIAQIYVRMGDEAKRTATHHGDRRWCTSDRTAGLSV